MVEDMIQGYTTANIPLEHVWLDIPYMNNSANFVVNKTAFGNLDKLAHTLHDKGMKLVAIVDPGLQVDANNVYYTSATKLDVLIKSTVYPNLNGGALTLKGVNGSQDVFLDFFNVNSSQVWQ